MRKAKLYVWVCVFLLLLAGVVSVQGQDLVTGIVVDSASLSALPSVNIQVKGGSRGTRTDEKGNFTILASRTDTLVFSLVGFEKLELPLQDYEPGMIRLNEKYTLLEAVTIDEYRREDMYEGMFDEQNARLKKSIPFYLSKAKKEKIKVQVLREENLRVKTYVDVVVNSPDLKSGLMKKHSLSEKEYYNILTAFNERHYRVMYYLTQAELISLLNTFFEGQASLK
ncbi:MAG: carboxypeptidase-like regulatory domain-containing protein [Cyclobacteriaceae bacterium]